MNENHDTSRILGPAFLLQFITSLSPGDKYLSGGPHESSSPKRVRLAGRVEAVGDQVTRFRPGDEVFASCSHTPAEYVSVPEDKVTPKPANLTFVQAAAVPTAAVTTRQVAGMYLASPNDTDMVFLSDLIEAGKLRPVIDRTYPLHQTADAFCYLEESHAQGKVVITVIE